MSLASPQGAVVLPFPQRFVEGERWEAWVDEYAVAAHFDVSTRTVRRWRVQGCPSGLIVGARRYRIGELEHWHAERSRTA